MLYSKREPRGSNQPLPTYIPQIEAESLNFDPQVTIGKIMADGKLHSERRIVKALTRVYELKAARDVKTWLNSHLDDLDLKSSGMPKKKSGGLNPGGQTKVYSAWKLRQKKDVCF